VARLHAEAGAGLSGAPGAGAPARGDRARLYAASFLRAAATGAVGVLAGIYLGRIGVAVDAAGVVIGAGITGATLATLLVTWGGAKLPRGRILVLLALASAGGLAAFACAPASVPLLAAAAFAGMLNAVGRERGPALAIEQAILADAVVASGRTSAFAWYNLVQDGGHAVGGALAAAPALLRRLGLAGEVAALRIVLLACAGLGVAGAVAYAGLSPAAAQPIVPGRVRLAAESRRIVRRISALFAVDAFGGGLVSRALLSLFLYERFGLAEAQVASLFVAASVANTGSHLGAAWLARRIGLVRTMVFTHIPSSVLLAAVPLAPSFPAAAAFFLGREVLVEMDVPTRQSYVMAVVRPEERVAASAITQLVRLFAWIVAPVVAGRIMRDVAPATPIFAAAALKIGYDLLLWKAFRHVKPPEERDAG
jgi:hypothetical protein